MARAQNSEIVEEGIKQGARHSAPETFRKLISYRNSSPSCSHRVGGQLQALGPGPRTAVSLSVVMRLREKCSSISGIDGEGSVLPSYNSPHVLAVKDKGRAICRLWYSVYPAFCRLSSELSS